MVHGRLSWTGLWRSRRGWRFAFGLRVRRRAGQCRSRRRDCDAGDFCLLPCSEDDPLLRCGQRLRDGCLADLRASSRSSFGFGAARLGRLRRATLQLRVSSGLYLVYEPGRERLCDRSRRHFSFGLHCIESRRELCMPRIRRDRRRRRAVLIARSIVPRRLFVLHRTEQRQRAAGTVPTPPQRRARPHPSTASKERAATGRRFAMVRRMLWTR